MISLHIDADTPDGFKRQLAAVATALLGSAAAGAIAASGAGKANTSSDRTAGAGAGIAGANAGTGQSSEQSDTQAESLASGSNGSTATSGASPSEASDPNDVDAGGHPWSPELHASTKSMTKEGYWRMKVGVSRPADLPGFPKADGATSTANNGAESQAPATAAAPTAGEDDDEFAAFRAAASTSAATDAAAAASVPARKWTDADLGKLCNEAAMKLNDPAPIKAIITDFVPQGEVAHSRNIPEDKREDFAKAIEAKAGITFSGS